MAKSKPSSTTKAEISQTESGTGVKLGTEEAAGMAYLSAIHASQTALLDSINFMRNNHVVYTASLAAAVKSMLQGNEQAKDTLDMINRSLQDSEQHFENVSKMIESMLSNFLKP